MGKSFPESMLFSHGHAREVADIHVEEEGEDLCGEGEEAKWDSEKGQRLSEEREKVYKRTMEKRQGRRLLFPLSSFSFPTALTLMWEARETFALWYG